MYSLWLERRLQLLWCCWVMQQEEAIKLSSDYSTSQIPSLSSFLPPYHPIATSRQNTSPRDTFKSLSIYAQNILADMWQGRKDALFPPPPLPVPVHPHPSLPLPTFHRPALKVTIILCPSLCVGGWHFTHTQAMHMLGEILLSMWQTQRPYSLLSCIHPIWQLIRLASVYNQAGGCITSD